VLSLLVPVPGTQLEDGRPSVEQLLKLVGGERVVVDAVPSAGVFLPKGSVVVFERVRGVDVETPQQGLSAFAGDSS